MDILVILVICLCTFFAALATGAVTYYVYKYYKKMRRKTSRRLERKGTKIVGRRKRSASVPEIERPSSPPPMRPPSKPPPPPPGANTSSDRNLNHLTTTPLTIRPYSKVNRLIFIKHK